MGAFEVVDEGEGVAGEVGPCGCVVGRGGCL
jgi:hypothetical protein